MLGVVNDCVGRIRRSRRIRQSTPDATLARLIMPTAVAERRPDKAFTPHPAIGARCLMRRLRVLSCLQSVRVGRPDKAFTPHPASFYQYCESC